jgi:hypothetical protein
MTSQRAMFKFCTYLAGIDRKLHPVVDKLYFGMDGEDGDNSALGHHIILLLSGQEKFKKSIHEQV